MGQSNTETYCIQTSYIEVCSIKFLNYTFPPDTLQVKMKVITMVTILVFSFSVPVGKYYLYGLKLNGYLHLYISSSTVFCMCSYPGVL